jgi:hypothetical protein
MPSDPSDLDPDRLALVVVGAHLRAEVEDRPLAYHLREQMLARLGDHPAANGWRVALCTDVWYLNNAELRARPTISVGGPGVNALSAYLGDKLPSAFAIEGRLVVQLDLDYTELLACCWGVNQTATAAAVEAFIDKYLEGFLEAAVGA